MEKEIRKPLSPSLSIWGKSRRWVYDKRWYFLAFFLPVVILFVSYAVFKVHPFGDNSVLVLDLNGQYVYYYEAYRDAFWGDGSFIYDWSRNLGGEMFGIFAYYLASPFMIIIYLLPRSMMMTSIMIVQLAKVGSAAVTMRYFLKKISPNKPKNVSLIVFPTIYAMMGYVSVQLMNPMWLDALIYLPLICWGVQRLVKEGRMLPYIIPLALMFISHFYIGYMVGIFTFFYFCYVCLSQEGRKLPKKFFSRCVYFGVGTFVALLCAAFVLIPVYNSLKLGKFNFTTPDFSLATQFDFLTFTTKLFPLSYDTVLPEGLPVIYCSAAALILVPLYFLNSKISLKEKTSSGILAALLVLIMYIKPADMVMHGFQVPQWLPFRYSFIFSFLLIIMSFRAFENLDGITLKNIGGIYAALMVFLFWCERENYSHFQIFETVTKDGKNSVVIQGIWASMILLSAAFVLLYVIKKYPKSKMAALIFAGVVSLELYANNVDTFRKIDKTVVYSKYYSYEPFYTDLRSAVKSMKEFDKEPFYRMEANFHRTVNDAIGSDYMGLSHSSSVMNAPVLKMLHKLGFAYGGHYTKYDGATYITDAVFDIKYLMTKNTDTADSRIVVPEEYKLAKHSIHGEALYKFYKNPNALGLGVATGTDIFNVVLGDDDPFANQNALLSALVGKNRNYFSRLETFEDTTNNVFRDMLVDGHTKYYVDNKNISDSHIDFLVKVDSDSGVYMFFPTSYERNCNVWVQDEAEYIKGEQPMSQAGQFFELDNYSILKIGDYHKGQTLRVRMTIDNKNNETFWKDHIFCSFDYETFAQDCKELQKHSLEVTKFEDTYVTGKVTADSDGQYLFTTIPVQDGWTVTVNGKEVKQQKALDCLMCVPLEKGENEIVFKFLPNYFIQSLIITGIGVLLLVLVFLTETKKLDLASPIKKLAGKFEVKFDEDDIDDNDDEQDDSKDVQTEKDELSNETPADEQEETPDEPTDDDTAQPDENKADEK